MFTLLEGLEFRSNILNELLMEDFVSAERDVPLSPVHPLRDEVQPDVQGQPDRPHPGGGGAERLVRRRERGLKLLLPQDSLIPTVQRRRTHSAEIHTCTHTLQCIKASVSDIVHPPTPPALLCLVKLPGAELSLQDSPHCPRLCVSTGSCCFTPAGFSLHRVFTSR